MTSPEDLRGDLDAFVALDCSNLERLGSLQEVAENVPNLINIDHHQDNKHFGSINVVDMSISSTAELIHMLLKRAGWDVIPEVASCLYTGLVTDTGSFQHRNTSRQTFITASELAEEGADIHGVAREVYYNKSISYAWLVGIVLQRTAVVEDCGLVYSYLTLEDMERTGAVLAETEDMIDFLRGVREGNVVALFRETKEGKTRVSLRSRDGFEVGPIARGMDGGGHAMAAGYTSDSDIDTSLRSLVDELRGETGGE